VVKNFAHPPSALGLARQVQHNRLSRQRLLVQPVATADHECRGLAQILHDDVIQDLAGVGYALSSLGEHIDEKYGPAVERLATIVRRDVELLRGMVADLVSPAGPGEPGKILQ
jgi:two-component system, NarL family, sensor kinase